jgi:hypothetical protein
MKIIRAILTILFVAALGGLLIISEQRNDQLKQQLSSLEDCYDSCNVRLNTLEQRHNWVIEHEHLLKFGKK